MTHVADIAGAKVGIAAMHAVPIAVQSSLGYWWWWWGWWDVDSCLHSAADVGLLSLQATIDIPASWTERRAICPVNYGQARQ